MSKYEGVDRYALQHFKGCHNRVRDGKSPSIFWPRTKEGYLNFCSEIGKFPEAMEKPSVGRIDHDKGYEPGNIRWEEHKFNSVKRIGTKYQNSIERHPKLDDRTPSFKLGSKEHREHQRKASLKRWSDPEQNKKMSERMQGNQHWKGKKDEG